jgi:hypothetical protein
MGDLDRRKALSDADHKALSTHQVPPGISECGLFASLGFPAKVILNYEDKPLRFPHRQLAYEYVESGNDFLYFVNNGVVQEIEAALQ